MSERAAPFYCPYCGGRGPASVRGGPRRLGMPGCNRAFQLKFLGLLARGPADRRRPGRRFVTTRDQHTAEELQALAEQAGRDLEDASALDILRWAADTFGGASA